LIHSKTLEVITSKKLNYHTLYQDKNRTEHIYANYHHDFSIWQLRQKNKIGSRYRQSFFIAFWIYLLLLRPHQFIMQWAIDNENPKIGGRKINKNAVYPTLNFLRISIPKNVKQISKNF